MIKITRFDDKYTQDVIDLVLHFQNDGTRPLVTVDDQPDMLHITDAYINAGGNFWSALDDGRLAGTIGIMPCGDDTAVLKNIRTSLIIWGSSSMLIFWNLPRKRDLRL